MLNLLEFYFILGEQMANKELIINSNLTKEQKVQALIMCISQEKTSLMTKELKVFNISLTQLQILHLLDFAPNGELTVNQIKEYMIDESPNVSRSLNKLMDNELIIKKRSEKDQRVVFIKITEEGKEIHKKADKELIKHTNMQLNEKEVNSLYTLLKKI